MAEVIFGFMPNIWSFAGSALASLIWLWFWLKEDPHPEPRRIIFLTFAAGAAMVPVALLAEEFVYNLGLTLGFWLAAAPTFFLLMIWSAVEEILKYLAAYFAAFRRENFDEPVDAPIYLITAALGFAAMENIFTLTGVFRQDLLGAVATVNLRFVGAVLLHIIASAAVGLSIACDFFHRNHRLRNALGGLALASLLHGVFNFFILKGGSENMLYVFGVVWLGVIVVILTMERIKQPQNH